METLSSGERDLVALGAALGSNCVPCAEHYVSEARNAGFTDRQIDEALRLADRVRREPAQKVLAAGLALLSKDPKSGTVATPEAQQAAADQGHTAVAKERPDSTDKPSQQPRPGRKSSCC
jgi:4-carboxymuconolactone decarboxylase